MSLLRSRRLETVLGSALDSISASDIQALPAAQVMEAFDLDFKGALYGNGDSQRRDLCGDVAALANASGGVIIIGVEEDGPGAACATPGVQLSDAERSRMLQVLASGIRTAHTVSPETVEQAAASPRRSHQRDVSEWVTLLDELTMQLATGLLYNRDLPTIDDPMRNLVDHYLRRVDGSKR